jgi:hypothetical protein
VAVTIDHESYDTNHMQHSLARKDTSLSLQEEGELMMSIGGKRRSELLQPEKREATNSDGR